MKIAVVGAGSWGTALALVLARKGLKTTLWCRRRELEEEIKETRQNSYYLPQIHIPPQVTPTSDLEEAVRGCQVVVLSVPSQAVRELGRRLRQALPGDILLVNTAKGLEVESLKRLSQVLQEEGWKRIAVLSGPSHAEEVARGLPTTVVTASENLKDAEHVQDIFMEASFRVYTSSDVIGVELGGALKNVIALATGIAEGLGLGDNARAALMTRGIAEMARLGVAMGARAMTFAGLSGIGDLIVTCTSRYSRNRRAGILLGQGRSLEEVISSTRMVIEGIRTTVAARSLAHRYGVRMPITEEVYQVLYGGKAPAKSVADLMGRPRTHEMEPGVW